MGLWQCYRREWPLRQLQLGLQATASGLGPRSGPLLLRSFCQGSAAAGPVDPPPHRHQNWPGLDLEQFPAAYDPPSVETGRYDWWEQRGYFRSGRHVPVVPPAGAPERWSMLLPPPNVTGALHIGHSLTCTLQDVLARWRRMQGLSVSWVPGLDHAGIATQTVVERRLMSSQGLDRHQLGREQFLERLWGWQQEYAERIQSQLRRMGVSTDWQREYFTLDEPRSRAVSEAFQRLFRDGLIYREARIVNWCPHLRTALSDVEVDTRHCDGPTNLELPGRDQKFSFGRAYELAYIVRWPETELQRAAEAGEQLLETVVIFTTRPETMFADVAVAVHPEDPRYAALLACPEVRLEQPLTGRRLPVIADSELVDLEMGSGAVKVSPAHDPADYRCAQRQGLATPNILEDDGTLVRDASLVPKEFQGLDRLDARVLLLRRLKESGGLLAVKPHAMTLAICSRTGDVLEPVIRPQWWIDCTRSGLGEYAAKAVPKLMPLLPTGVGHEETWRHWLGNIQDWCISRQLWWGHRIPAWQVFVEGAPRPTSVKEERWVVAETETAARSEVLRQWPELARNPGLRLVQDPDVLDTWFSSALLPLSAFGWPHNSNTSGGADDGGDAAAAQPQADLLDMYYPLSVMETGADILFFWVARMTMLCGYLDPQAPPGQLGRLPFDKVFLHPMIRDAKGAKMSKSVGNVVDPIHLIEGRSLSALQEEALASASLPEVPPEPVRGQPETEAQKEFRTGRKRLRQRLEQQIRKNVASGFPEGLHQCGTDAVRMYLSAAMMQSRAIPVSPREVRTWRHFCNKLWQATRFVALQAVGAAPAVHRQTQLADVATGGRLDPSTPAWLADRWILLRLEDTVRTMNSMLSRLQFGEACNTIRVFLLDDFCSGYLELAKQACFRPMEVARMTLELQKLRDPEANFDDLDLEALADRIQTEAVRTLVLVLETSLRLLHPFAPFVTEELWQLLRPMVTSELQQARQRTPTAAAADTKLGLAQLALLDQLWSAQFSASGAVTTVETQQQQKPWIPESIMTAPYPSPEVFATGLTQLGSTSSAAQLQADLVLALDALVSLRRLRLEFGAVSSGKDQQEAAASDVAAKPGYTPPADLRFLRTAEGWEAQTLDGENLGRAVAQETPDEVDLLHIGVDDKFAGQGRARQIVDFVASVIRDQGRVLVPTCTYVRDNWVPKQSASWPGLRLRQPDSQEVLTVPEVEMDRPRMRIVCLPGASQEFRYQWFRSIRPLLEFQCRSMPEFKAGAVEIVKDTKVPQGYVESPIGASTDCLAAIPLQRSARLQEFVELYRGKLEKLRARREQLIEAVGNADEAIRSASQSCALELEALKATGAAMDQPKLAELRDSRSRWAQDLVSVEHQVATTNRTLLGLESVAGR